MKNSLAIMVVVSFGTFAMAQQKQPVNQVQSTEMLEMASTKQDKHMDRMKSELNLSDAQVLKLNAIQERNKAQRNVNKQEARNRMALRMEKRANADKELKEILSPEQYKKWEVNRGKKVEMRKSKMKLRKSKMKLRASRMENKRNIMEDKITDKK